MSYMVGREDKRTNNRTMLPTLKNNASAGYQGPKEIELLRGAGPLGAPWRHTRFLWEADCVCLISRGSLFIRTKYAMLSSGIRESIIYFTSDVIFPPSNKLLGANVHSE